VAEPSEAPAVVDVGSQMMKSWPSSVSPQILSPGPMYSVCWLLAHCVATLPLNVPSEVTRYRYPPASPSEVGGLT
jgi:hypothetical protein